MNAPVPSDIVGRPGGLATGALANALDAIGRDQYATCEVRPVYPGVRFAGRAVTVKQRAGD